MFVLSVKDHAATDVLIIGGGMAGLTAATTTNEAGALREVTVPLTGFFSPCFPRNAAPTRAVVV